MMRVNWPAAEHSQPCGPETISESPEPSALPPPEVASSSCVCSFLVGRLYIRMRDLSGGRSPPNWLPLRRRPITASRKQRLAADIKPRCSGDQRRTPRGPRRAREAPEGDRPRQRLPKYASQKIVPTLLLRSIVDAGHQSCCAPSER